MMHNDMNELIRARIIKLLKDEDSLLPDQTHLVNELFEKDCINMEDIFNSEKFEHYNEIYKWILVPSFLTKELIGKGEIIIDPRLYGPWWGIMDYKPWIFNQKIHDIILDEDFFIKYDNYRRRSFENIDQEIYKRWPNLKMRNK